MKHMPIRQAATLVPCSEWQLRRLDTAGVVHPERDFNGRRQFGDDDVQAARVHLARRRSIETVAA